MRFFGRVSNDPGTRRKRRKWNKKLNVDTVAKLLGTMVNLTYNLCSHQARGTTFDQQLQLLCILFPLLTQAHPQKVKNPQNPVAWDAIPAENSHPTSWLDSPHSEANSDFLCLFGVGDLGDTVTKYRRYEEKGLFGLLCLEVCRGLYENGSHRPPYLDAWYIVHGYFGRIRK